METMKTILNELTTSELVEMVENFFDYEVFRDFAYTCPENAHLTMDEALRKWAIGTICEHVTENEIREYMEYLI